MDFNGKTNTPPPQMLNIQDNIHESSSSAAVFGDRSAIASQLAQSPGGTNEIFPSASQPAMEIQQFASFEGASDVGHSAELTFARSVQLESMPQTERHSSTGFVFVSTAKKEEISNANANGSDPLCAVEMSLEEGAQPRLATASNKPTKESSGKHTYQRTKKTKKLLVKKKEKREVNTGNTQKRLSKKSNASEHSVNDENNSAGHSPRSPVKCQERANSERGSATNSKSNKNENKLIGNKKDEITVFTSKSSGKDKSSKKELAKTDATKSPNGILAKDATGTDLKSPNTGSEQKETTKDKKEGKSNTDVPEVGKVENVQNAPATTKHVSSKSKKRFKHKSPGKVSTKAPTNQKRHILDAVSSSGSSNASVSLKKQKPEPKRAASANPTAMAKPKAMANKAKIRGGQKTKKSFDGLKSTGNFRAERKLLRASQVKFKLVDKDQTKKRATLIKGGEDDNAVAKEKKEQKRKIRVTSRKSRAKKRKSVPKRGKSKKATTKRRKKSTKRK